MLLLGDMLVVGEHAPKTWKALATISAHLHPAYDGLDETIPGYSKETCLFTSLAARDFLVAIGYRDATVKTCAVIARRFAGDQELWSVGLGVPGQRDRPEKFNGHAVAVVPSINLMIDCTLYQVAARPHMDALPGMVACEYLTEPIPNERGLPGFAGVEMRAAEADVRFSLFWGERNDLNFKREIDYRASLQRSRRRAMAATLTREFGAFEEAAS